MLHVNESTKRSILKCWLLPPPSSLKTPPKKNPPQKTLPKTNCEKLLKCCAILCENNLIIIKHCDSFNLTFNTNDSLIGYCLNFLSRIFRSYGVVTIVRFRSMLGSAPFHNGNRNNICFTTGTFFFMKIEFV